MLNQLLSDLGFEKTETTDKNNCIWEHGEAGTRVVLPANRVLDEALQIDLQPLRMKLHLNGHLETAAFDTFLAKGKLPQVS